MEVHTEVVTVDMEMEELRWKRGSNWQNRQRSGRRHKTQWRRYFRNRKYLLWGRVWLFRSWRSRWYRRLWWYRRSSRQRNRFWPWAWWRWTWRRRSWRIQAQGAGLGGAGFGGASGIAVNTITQKIHWQWKFTRSFSWIRIQWWEQYNCFILNINWQPWRSIQHIKIYIWKWFERITNQADLVNQVFLFMCNFLPCL